MIRRLRFKFVAINMAFATSTVFPRSAVFFLYRMLAPGLPLGRPAVAQRKTSDWTTNGIFICFRQLNPLRTSTRLPVSMRAVVPDMHRCPPAQQARCPRHRCRPR